MRTIPRFLIQTRSIGALLIDCLVVLYGIGCLMQDIIFVGPLGVILIRLSGHVQLWASDTTEVPGLGLNHRHRHRHSMDSLLGENGIGVYDFRTTGDGGLGMDPRLFNLSCLASSRPFLAGHVLFREALLFGFCFPVIIPNAPSVNNDSCPKLSEHGSGGHNRNLTRTIRVRENLLVDQFVLLRLRCYNLEQRAILVEEEVGVSVVQDSCTLRSQHEQLVSPVRNIEGPHLVSATIIQVTLCIHFLLTRLVEFSWNVFIPFRRQNVGRVVPYSR